MTDKKKYDGWLVSNNFLKRCFAVIGHGLIAYMIITAALYIFLRLFGVEL